VESAAPADTVSLRDQRLYGGKTGTTHLAEEAIEEAAEFGAVLDADTDGAEVEATEVAGPSQ